ncbi:MAG: PAS domain S-box protein [Verrucomicrobia bacterium]|nr:PAS domain S-box protein [Verrucomicrobiota bacterium]
MILPADLPPETGLQLVQQTLAICEHPMLLTTPEVEAPGPRILFANAAFTELCGYSARELQGRSPRMLQGERTDPGVLAELKSTLRRGRAFHGATWNYHRDGSPYFFSWSVYPVRTAERQIVAWVSCQRKVEAEMTLDDTNPFEVIFRQAPLGMSVTDEYGHFVRVNPAFQQLTGRSESQLIGQTVDSLALPQVREAVRRRYSESVRGDDGHIHAGDLVRPDGSSRRVLVRRGRLVRPDGSCMMVNSVLDVTEREAALAARDEAERRYHGALERLPMLALAEDTEGRVTYCNPCAGRTLGWDPEELTGQSVFETIVPREEAELKRRTYLAWMRGDGEEAGGTYETFNMTRSGARLRIRWHVSELRSSEGERQGVLCFGQDLTDALRVAAESAENRELLQALYVGTPDLMFLFDSEMRFLQVHGRPDLLLRPAEELLGRRYLDVSSSAHALETHRLYAEALATGEVQVIEYPAEVPAGRRRFEARLVRCGAQRGLAIVRDVTEQRALEAQLLQAQKMEAIGQLAGGIAHDFNNLLTVMLGGLDLIRLEPNHPDRSLLEMAVESAHRAADLTQQLLDYSRQGPLAEEEFDLAEVLRDTTRLLARTFGPRHTLRLELPPEPISVRGDPRKIRQVVMNLCLNARDAIPGDGVVRVGCGWLPASEVHPPLRLERPHRVFAWFSVSDNGIGMTLETRQRMFDPFFTTKERGKGTGLGLATVLGVTEQHGGWVECDSQPGAGSEFRVFLPGGGGGSAGAPNPARERAEDGTRGLSCLLVDDEPHVLLTARMMLEREGFKVLPAASAREAIDILGGRVGEIDLVFLDLMMPSLSGDEALGRLRELDPRVRIILMSGGLLSEEDRPPGADGWLAKPFRRDQLVAAARAALAGARPATE